MFLSWQWIDIVCRNDILITPGSEGKGNVCLKPSSNPTQSLAQFPSHKVLPLPTELGGGGGERGGSPKVPPTQGTP